MRVKSILLVTILTIASLVAIPASAVDKPDFGDPYVPQIRSVSFSYETKQGSGQYSIDLKFNLVVRVHRNPLSTFEIFFSGGKSEPLSPCQAMGGTQYTYGDYFYTKPGNFNVPTGLVSRKADGDWFIETHQFEIPGWRAWPGLNLNFPPCKGTYQATQIQMRDLAGHGVRISTPQEGNLVPYQYNLDDLPLDPEQSTCSLNPWSAKLCTQQIKFESFEMTFANTNSKSESQITIVDFQAQNIILKSQVEDLNNKIKALTSDKTSLQSQVASLTSDKTSLQSQVASLTSDKTSLQSQVASLSSARAELSALQKRFQTICKAKPKPKGC